MQKQIIVTPIQSDYLIEIKGVKLVTEFINFAIWAGTPRQFREQETQKEFAQSIGVSEDTLTDWKKHPQFKILFLQSIKNWTMERIPDAIGGLYSKITSEKVTGKDVEMFMKLSGLNIINKEEK